MPLNHEFGEITAYGTNYVTVPVSKWAETNIFEMAYRLGLGIMNKRVRTERFDPTEILVQEYHVPSKPTSPHLVFFFHRRFNGRDWYADVPVRFPEVTLRELVLAGHWPSMDGPRLLLAAE